MHSLGMTQRMFSLPALMALALAACQQPPNDTDIAIDNEINAAEAANAEIETLPPSEQGGAADGNAAIGAAPTTGKIGADRAPRIPVPSATATEANGMATPIFPDALLGKWRQTDGAIPTARECAGSENGNIAKVLDIRSTNFSIFEEGGRIIRVTDRTDRRMRATFDTTYADTPTRDDLTFTVDPVSKTLTLINNDPGEASRKTYKRCPR